MPSVRRSIYLTAIKSNNMKTCLLIFFLIFVHLLSAQSFTEQRPKADFAEVSNSSVAYADVDGDNDQDAFIIGEEAGSKIAKLYLNNGNGRFTEATNSSFIAASHGHVAFADINGDNDFDLFVTGIHTVSNKATARLYTNNGTGKFSMVPNTPFENIEADAFDFADIDGDSDLDLLITGYDIGDFTKLFTNNGIGAFTEVSGTSFQPVGYGTVNFSDVDGDNDQDVFITGRTVTASSGRTAILYTNDGSGAFSKVSGTPFVGVSDGDAAFFDVDGDNDKDLLLTGRSNGSGEITNLYLNNGSGTFSQVQATGLEPVKNSNIAFGDINGDNDLDLLITGSGYPASHTKLYDNDGTGAFTEVTTAPFEDITLGSSAFADVDGDNDLDLLITGSDITNMFLNDGTGTFSGSPRTPFLKASESSVAFADIDGDNDQDLIITGSGKFILDRNTTLYINDGNADFSKVLNTPFWDLNESSVAFADIDGDNDQDLLMTGNAGGTHTSMFKNDGSGEFSYVHQTPFYSVYHSSVAFADVDGDNDQDLVITGMKSAGTYIAKLYTNDGSGKYGLVPGTPFVGVKRSSIAFADIDGDNDQDLLITGEKPYTHEQTKLYTNDGSGTFSEVTNTPFDSVSFSSIAFADIDGDNDQDLLITGHQGFSTYITKLYSNDGSGTFSEVPNTPFEEVQDGSVAFADVDADGDLDVFICGETSANTEISKLYTNDGTGTFSEVTGTPFKGVKSGSIAFADVDGDTDLDLLITGSHKAYPISVLYLNDAITLPIDPLAQTSGFAFTAYPNPNRTNTLHINYESKENGRLNIQIFDLSGRLLTEQQKNVTIGQQEFTIDLKAMTPGSYFIQLYDGKRQGIRKIVIQ